MVMQISFNLSTYSIDALLRASNVSISLKLDDVATAVIFRRAHVSRYSLSCCPVVNEHILQIEKLQVTYNHVVSEAIKGCSAIAECLRERMVDNFVKHILVPLE